jgi:MFS family permease
MFKYPTIVISVFGYCFLQYWWILSVTTLIPDAYIAYSPRIQGALLVGLLVGLLLAELVCSGHMSDRIMIILTKKNGGKRIPEMRLWLGIPAAVISAIGLLVWGLSVDKGWHWITGQIAFALCKLNSSINMFNANLTDGLGLQMGNTVVSAYIVDNYPEHANEVITFYTVIINVSATIILYDYYLPKSSYRLSSIHGLFSTGSKHQVCEMQVVKYPTVPNI